MKNLRLQIIVLHVLFSLTIVNAQEKLPDSDPKLISETTYKIPQSAIDAEIDGKVGIGFRIDKTGTPIKANVIAGPMWPCSTKPIKALDDLYADLSKEMLKLRFSPAIKNGKPVEKEVGLAFMLENPRVGPKPADVDPITGKFKVTTINGGILNGKATSLPKPVYPDDAKAHRDSGMVIIQVLIDEQGIVTRAGAINGMPRLQFASREAACAAKFTPTLLEGRPIKVSGTITYAFFAN